MNSITSRPFVTRLSAAAGTLLLALASCTSAPTSRFDAAADSIEQMQARIPGVIAPEDRADEIRNQLASWRTTVSELEAFDMEYTLALASLNADPGAARSDFDQVTGDFDKRRRALLEELLDRRDTLITLTTPTEWSELGGTP